MLPFIFFYIGYLEAFLERQFHRRTWNIIPTAEPYCPYKLNMNKKPEKDFNTCDDYFQLVITCFILSIT